ncbi:RlmE family RNA methyltransferase [Candidatus Woesearchaeota archaeon]|nr:MAG: RlmE family RNA methyltransferase [Candidatus Woesearchaeota archaeon]
MRDSYTIKAKKEGMRARSAYKLVQLNRKYKLVGSNDDVLDLGCWPGGWLVALTKITKGKVVGVDLNEIQPVNGVEFIKADVFKFKINEVFDVVISDMAPKTTGIHELDCERSIDLAEAALSIAKKNLKPGGNFLVKVFQGKGFDDFLKSIKKCFAFVKTTKPEASRKRSKEIYVIGFKLKSQCKL